MRGRGVPPLVKKIVFGILAKVLFIQLDIPETNSKVKVWHGILLHSLVIICHMSYVTSYIVVTLHHTQGVISLLWGDMLLVK